MSSAHKFFCAMLATFGLMVGFGATPVAALEKKEEVKPAVKVEKVDVNNATAKELEDGLDGVGPATAKKIIAGRPYKNLEELVKAGVPQKTADKFAAEIVFGDHKAAKADKTDKKEEPKADKTDKKDEPKVAKTDKKEDTEAKVPPKKGMVWVNTDSKVWHVEGDRWYGKTKKGEFMTEEDAVKAGAHKSKND